MTTIRNAALLLLTLRVATTLHAQGPRPSAPPKVVYAEPGISPDGREIAFVSGGDIWSVAAGGGDARLVVGHPANESRPLYSPDGTRLAFMSNRAGSNDIWILALASGELRRLTWDDGNEQLDGWSRDGNWIYFSSTAHDVAGMSDVYRVRSSGGTPMPVAADRYASEFMSAPSADGNTVAIVGRGNALSQWWRKGHSHLDESELWLVRGDGSKPPQYEQLMPRGAKQQWPMWARGDTLFFVSDRGTSDVGPSDRTGAQNIWVKGGRGEARALSSFKDGRVMWPSIAADGRTIAFERDFGIWMFDVVERRAREVPITLRGAAVVLAPEHLVLTTGFTDLALSPDGKKVAFIARGDVFAANAAEGGGGDAQRITSTPSIETQVTWAPDSRRLAYTANRDGAWHLFLYDFPSAKEVQLTSGNAHDVSPRFSPDGREVAFLRGGVQLSVVAIESKVVRNVATGTFGRPPFFSERPITWSPDGKWIAYLSGGERLFMNAWVVPSSGGGGAARQVSWLANTRANTISWSADGGYLLLDTGMRMEPGQLARVDLIPYLPKFREEQFESLFRDVQPGRTTPGTPPPASAPAPMRTIIDSSGSITPDPRNVPVVFEGIRDRLSIVPIGLDVGVQGVSADGKQVFVTAGVAGQQNIFLYSFDEYATDPTTPRQLTTTTPNKNSVQFAPDGKTLWYLEGGRITSTTIETRTSRTLNVRAELDVDFAAEKWEVFHQAWEFLNDNFYDPEFHGTNWNAVRSGYAPYIAGSKTPDEMRRVLSLMIGEMNASHMGINSPPPPGGPPAPVTARLGLEFDRATYEQGGNLRITTVIPLGAAALAGGVAAGAYLVAVDGAPIRAGVNLDSLVAFKVGKRVVLTVAADAAGTNRRDVALRGRSAAYEKSMLYRAWVNERRTLVAQLSNGRLGYVHMIDMGGNALANLNLDLDSEMSTKEGVVFDVRANSGGFMNGHALDVLQRTPYVDMNRRGVPTLPGRPFLGQRALGRPTILLTSQHTLSDGENFTEGYRTMHLGKVVGEPTAEWDVYTGAGTMVDGTSVRLPFMRNAQLDGAALERKSRTVDVPVDRPMGESYSGRDTQVEAAVKELLAQLGNARPAGRNPD